MMNEQRQDYVELCLTITRIMDVLKYHIMGSCEGHKSANLIMVEAAESEDREESDTLNF